MRSFSLFLFLSFSNLIFSQSELLPGYWKVNLVTVGQDTMTPVSKWFHLGAGGDLQGGNGGNINLFGTWKNSADTSLLFTNSTGEPDPAGPFRISWDKDTLILKRTEERQAIQVILQAYEPKEWPQAPWDKIAGGWELTAPETADDTDALRFHTAFFRWDNNVLFNRGSEHVSFWTALWRIHAHRPQLELAPRNEGAAIMTWNIEFSGDQMIWTRILDGNEQRLIWTKND